MLCVWAYYVIWHHIISCQVSKMTSHHIMPSVKGDIISFNFYVSMSNYHASVLQLITKGNYYYVSVSKYLSDRIHEGSRRCGASWLDRISCGASWLVLFTVVVRYWPNRISCGWCCHRYRFTLIIISNGPAGSFIFFPPRKAPRMKAPKLVSRSRESKNVYSLGLGSYKLYSLGLGSYRLGSGSIVTGVNNLK